MIIMEAEQDAVQSFRMGALKEVGKQKPAKIDQPGIKSKTI
jgi:hypothetical protein